MDGPSFWILYFGDETKPGKHDETKSGQGVKRSEAFPKVMPKRWLNFSIPKVSILSFKGCCFVVRCLDFGRFQPRQIPKVIPSPSPGRSWPRCATRIWRSSVRRIDPWPGTSMTSKLPAPGLGILEEMREMRDPKFPKFPK